MQKVTAKDIIKCINIARQYPKYYIPIIDQQISTFISDNEYQITKEIICETNEGKEAWIQAKQFLLVQSSLSPFVCHKGLTKAAEKHSIDLQSMDAITHSGKNGNTFVDRIMEYCNKSEGALVEIIGSAFRLQNINLAEMIVLGLIIDDGIKTKGHRNAIFNSSYKYIGCSLAALSDKIAGVLNLSQINLKEKQKNYSHNATSTSQLASESNFASPRKQFHQNMVQMELSKSLNSQINRQNQKVKQFNDSRQSLHASKVSISSKSSKKQVWTFNRMDAQNSRISEQNSIKKQKQYMDQKSTQSLSQFEILSKKSGRQKKQKQNIKSSSFRQDFLSSSQKDHAKSHSNPIQDLKDKKFNGSQITNQYLSETANGTNSGFKKIKKKKQIFKQWEDGEFKMQEKVTFIKYTDGTKQNYKQKQSILIE